MGNPFKVLFCCGSRPELIKISPVFHKLAGLTPLSPQLCLTGQHTDLLAPHLDYFGLTADYQLHVLQNGQTLDRLMAKLLDQLPAIFSRANPDLVIVQGDTASALAAAITAQRMGLRVAHIEAGLRTYDRSSPFPEEINRQIITRLADWHFCPTEQTRRNLVREGIPDQAIFVTGNTAVDVLLKTRRACPVISSSPPKRRDGRPYFLMTLHRRESQGAPLMRIINSLLAFARQRPAYDFILPLHPNPLTAGMIHHLMGHQQNIMLVPAQTYPHMVQLMAGAFAVITDSGGLQEEAPSLNTPLVILRDNTERPEGIEAGCLRLAGTDPRTILYELNLLIDDPAHYKRMQQAENPFGDGFAADRICARLINLFERQDRIYAK